MSMSEPVSEATLARWEKLAQDANCVFQGQPMEDVGGALALLTAMLIAGLMQGEGPLTETAFKAKVAWTIAQHGKLVYDLLPAFLDAIEEQGGWDAMSKQGRH
jgi:hypothetical protein